ncbi:glycosyltransferase [Desulfogranum marinum]|uniref:glycosyltransferase n=1 Tax=Desulfogranum marinum TaxID=453220 RepID=UPI0029C7B8CD|nr:glycosyltransferase [Desulfogranum marinum]
MTDSKRKIKLLFGLNTTTRAGVEEHVLSLLSKLDPNDFDFFLLTTSCLHKKIKNDLSSLPVKHIIVDVKGFFDYKSFFKIFSIIKEIKPDILHSHMFISGFYYSPIGFMLKVPVIIETIHGIERHRAEKGNWGKYSFFIDKCWSHFTDKYIGVSNACSRDINDLKGIDKNKINTIHNGRNLNYYKPVTYKQKKLSKKRFGINNKIFVFGTLARLEYQKGHEYLLEATSLLLNRISNFKVLIVGSGNLEKHLKNKADRLKLCDNIIWAGFQKNISQFLSAMDVHILPSLYEGLPLVAIEALAAKVPMIATDVDGTPEVIIDNITGLLVKPRNAQDLCEKMFFAYSNQKEMERMASNGYRFVHDNFTEEIQISKTKCLYLDLLHNKM